MYERLRSLGFAFETKNHAEAILTVDFPDVASDLVEVLSEFHIAAKEIIGSGGGQAASTMRLRDALYSRGWPKHEFTVQTIVDGSEREAITHEIDHVLSADNGTLALEIEWNNKDPFFDRDLENFQRLHAQGAISLGILITRGPDMQARMADIVEWVICDAGINDVAELEAWGMKERTARQKKMLEERIGRNVSFARAFAESFVSDKYGMATTHWDKLMTRVSRGVGNPCPLLLIGLPVSVVADYSAATLEL
ncbi:BglII/BstYI family type II restriction endonuclease [Roseovarius sp. E0-M6]|uniref:BglII/BstYI family type II restriction endonuclease n=1 Tax=Roseovarius sp. E0-M6 TaxID=3127118 RepID=UPI00301047E8